MSALTSSKDSRIEAANRGLDVYIPKEGELSLDLDNEEAEIIFKTNYQRWCDFFETFIPYRETTSQNGGKHIYLEWPDDRLNVPTKCAIQATLGSDLLREMNSLFRFLAKDPEPIMMFEVRSKDA